jgi:hypothetical protein
LRERFRALSDGEMALTLIPSSSSSIAMAIVKALRAVAAVKKTRGRYADSEAAEWVVFPAEHLVVAISE